MVEEYVVIVDEDAKINLRNIYNWLKENESISVAVKVRDGITTAITQLSKMPQRHAVAHEIDNDKIIYRRALQWSYKIVFVVEEDFKTVYVVDITHSRRSPKWLEEKFSK